MRLYRPALAHRTSPADRFYALLLLGGLLGLVTPAGAVTIKVNSTAPNVIFDGNCTLREAILAANSDTTGDCPAGSGADTIVLPAGTYTFTTPDNYWYGPNALPAISSTITVEGNGAIIERDASAATKFRLFYVSGGLTNGLAAGHLTLKDLTLRNGHAKGGDSYAGGSGLGRAGRSSTRAV